MKIIFKHERESSGVFSLVETLFLKTRNDFLILFCEIRAKKNLAHFKIHAKKPRGK